MKKVKAGLCLLLAVALCAGTAGCKDKNSDSQNSSQASSSVDQNSSEASGKPQEIATLKWVCLGEDQQNAEPVYQKVNELLGERYGLALDFETYPAGTYDEKMNMKINSGEEYDLCYTSQSWLNKYPVQVAKGAFLALDDYLDDFTKLKEALPEFLFEQARINGKIYAIPNYQISYSSWGFTFQKAIVEEMKEAGIDWDYTEIKTFWDAEPFWEFVKEKHPELYPYGTGVGDELYFTQNKIDGNKYIDVEQGSIDKDDPEHKVFMDALLSKEEQLEMNNGSWVIGINNRKLLEKGYIRPDVATVQDQTADMAAGRFASSEGVIKPGGEAEVQIKSGGIEWVQVAVQVPFVGSTAARSTMTAVSSKSKQPEAALKMIEVMNTDAEIFNTLNFGIEGQNYTLEDGKVQAIENSGYFYNSAWAIGNQFNAILMVSQQDGIWEETDKINREAEVTPVLGYTFDPEPVTAEIAAMSAIKKEFDKWYWEDDYEARYDQYVEKMREPATVVLAESQKQLDAWWEANKK